jgi:hypothetical protein
LARAPAALGLELAAFPLLCVSTFGIPPFTVHVSGGGAHFCLRRQRREFGTGPRVASELHLSTTGSLACCSRRAWVEISGTDEYSEPQPDEQTRQIISCDFMGDAATPARTGVCTLRHAGNRLQPASRCAFDAVSARPGTLQRGAGDHPRHTRRSPGQRRKERGAGPGAPRVRSRVAGSQLQRHAAGLRLISVLHWKPRCL